MTYNEMQSSVSSTAEILADFRAGKMVILIDDEDRENEGDLLLAADFVTPEAINFMATHARGLICLTLTEERCRRLRLPLMTAVNGTKMSTNFTMSIEAAEGVTTGISAADRAKTIQAAVAADAKPSDIVQPGHVFPVMARPGGVLTRAGHTEAGCDLGALTGLTPSAVICEIMKEDGTMARLPDLLEISKKYGFKIISIEDLIRYRLQRESIIEQGVESTLPTRHGTFRIIPFRQKSNGLEHVALVKGEWAKDEPVLVRVHSSCLTGDVFESYRCDCGSQLHEAMERIDRAGKGVVVYINQEGRGIGIFNKIHAYKLQDEGFDTVEANEQLGFKADERDYGVGASILRAVGVSHMRLMTNNPVKRTGLEGYGLIIDEIVPIEIEPNEYNRHYLETKRDKMGHNILRKKE